MTTWQALTTTDHAQSGWTRFKSYQHAQNDALAPVLAAEIPQLLSSYALAFALKADPHNTTQHNKPPPTTNWSPCSPYRQG